ncbi:MAG: HAMP domain-containing histidine kinase [Alphaproteobacteria bacterium]|nr:HAMP domain-containing histidine kinase [Alphaproteobacteria bacterium]
MLRSLHAKLALALLGLLGLVGLAYVILTVTTTRFHIQEVTQSLNRSLAADLARSQPLIKSGTVDKAALKRVFDMLMVVNPAIEVYLLGADGKLIAYSAPPEKIKRGRVALGPVRDFLAPGAKLPIRGDDPRSGSERKIFSAAPITEGGRLQGYLYVVLGGESYQSVAGMLETSWIMRLGGGVAAASLALIAVLGVLLFAWLTRRLRRLTARMESFRSNDPARPLTSGAAAPGRAADEIDTLALTFDAMARRIDEQVAALEEANTLRQELIANISHDLRTPLASLQGAIETLQMKDASLGAEEKRRYLALAHKHSQRLGRLITDLFDLTTLESEDRQLHTEPFSLAELVQDVAQRFRAMADEKGLSLEIDIPLNSSPVEGDIGLIERVLANLTENAIKYTPAGGRIDLGVHGGAGRISVRVRDTGIGIPADELPRVFERSYRVGKERGGGPDGAGLGLAIAKRIVELHGGELLVESEPGTGTAFTFDLPAARTT